MKRGRVSIPRSAIERSNPARHSITRGRFQGSSKSFLNKQSAGSVVCRLLPLFGKLDRYLEAMRLGRLSYIFKESAREYVPGLQYIRHACLNRRKILLWTGDDQLCNGPAQALLGFGFCAAN